jgi:hypothetical protein
VELGFMAVPAGAFFGRHVGPDDLGDHLAAGCIGDAEVAVDEEVPQAVGAEARVFRLDVREQGGC